MSASWGLACLFMYALLVACSGESIDLRLGEERLSENEAQHTADLISAIEAVSLDRHPEGVIQRFNQAKSLGCFDARFRVNADLEEELRQGIFAGGPEYPAVLRIASATQEDDREKDFRGLSIAVHGISGKSLWGDSGQQDFLLNSYPALFAADPGDFLDFIEASASGNLWLYFVNPGHFYSLPIVLKGRRKITNPFAIQYWSTTPYRFGEETSSAVKYSVRPCAGTVPDFTVDKNKNFLTDAMHEHLRQSPACLEFTAQFQTDPKTMPIENAAVVWDEEESPFYPLAQILIEAGKTSSSTRERCEAMTFNPWQSLEAHRPLGGINRSRRAIYAEIGDFRKTQNRRRASQ